MNRFIICLCLLFSLSCSPGLNDDSYYPKDPILYPAPNKMYVRDSVYLAYTVSQYINRGDVQGYGGIPKENFLRIDIDTILYSPDTLKLFSFVITYTKDTEDKKNPYGYFGQVLIGYRTSTHEPWIIYPGVHFARFLGYLNYNKIKNRLRLEFFHKFKDENMWYWSNEKQQRELFTYKYNANDPKFWDSCHTWQKGVSIPGYYIFQLRGNVTPDMDDLLFKQPEVHYPDSLLKLYYENKW